MKRATDSIGIDHPLIRIYAEFIEMPGLRLTVAQGQRLWGIDRDTCTQALTHLVDARFLAAFADGTFARRSDGLQMRPPLPPQRGAA